MAGEGGNGSAATLTALLARAAARRGAPAFIYGGRAVAYGELADLAVRLAGGLARLGVGAGDRVALWLPNTPAYLALYFACARLGAVAVAVNTRFRAVEVADIVGRSGAKVLVLWPDFRQIPFLDILADVDPAALDALEAVVVYGEGETPSAVAGKRTVAYDDLAKADPHRAAPAGADAACGIFTTSGTTKAPKFVLHRQFSLARHGEEVAADFAIVADASVVFNPLPLCGVFGLSLAFAALAAGAPMVIEAAFDAEVAGTLMRRHRVTHTALTDDMLDRMLAARPEAAPFPSLAWTGYAAFNAALADLPRRAEARGVTVVGLWGMSEMQALVARRDHAAPLEERRKAGGRLVSPSGAFRIRDPESGEVLPPGRPGELEITGPSRMIGYYNDAKATAAALTADGYVRTGDLAEAEPGGTFHFLSRMGDVLRLGGFLVNPAEIEDHIQALDAVEGAQVVEVATPRGNRPVAFVTLIDAADEATLSEHCRAALAPYKVPVAFVVLDAFPVTESANGLKIQRNLLRDMARERVG